MNGFDLSYLKTAVTRDESVATARPSELCKNAPIASLLGASKVTFVSAERFEASPVELIKVTSCDKPGWLPRTSVRDWENAVLAKARTRPATFIFGIVSQMD